jgi:hypothetical protein
MFNKRLQAMGMAATNLKDRDVTTVKRFVMILNEMWNEHAFCSAFHHNRAIGKEQIGVRCLQVPRYKLRCFIRRSENFRQVDNG